MTSEDHKPIGSTWTQAPAGYTRNSALARAYRRQDELLNRARVRLLLEDPALTPRRPLYVIAGILLIVSIILRYPVLFSAGLLVLAIAVTPEIWYRFGLRGLVIRRAPAVSRTPFGSIVETPIEIENRGALPLPFVEIQDNFPDDTPTLGMSLEISPLSERAELVQVAGLWAFQRLRRRFYVHAARRGAFVFGPTVVRVTDPFGALAREETIATERTLIVHPLIAPLERFGVTPQSLFGDRASRLRLLEDPLRMSGVRQYAPGDDPRRVHWKATARSGTMQSKILDPSTQRTLMIALDVRTFAAAHIGFDPELSEYAISIAASLANWAYHEGYAVGALSNGSLARMSWSEGDARDAALDGDRDRARPGLAPRFHLEPSARPERLTMILDGFARLLPYSSASLATALVGERQALGAGAALVYVGLDALVDVPTIIALRELRSHGRDVTLLVTTRDADDTDPAGVDTRNLNAAGLRTRYVGGRLEWQSIVREALGELPYRRASAPLTAERLAQERAIMAERRRPRRHGPVGVTETSDDQSEQSAADLLDGGHANDASAAL